MKQTLFLLVALSMLAQAQVLIRDDFESLGKETMPRGWLSFVAGKKGKAFSDSENAFSFPVRAH